MNYSGTTMTKMKPPEDPPETSLNPPGIPWNPPRVPWNAPGILWSFLEHPLGHSVMRRSQLESFWNSLKPNAIETLWNTFEGFWNPLKLPGTPMKPHGNPINSAKGSQQKSQGRISGGKGANLEEFHGIIPIEILRKTLFYIDFCGDAKENLRNKNNFL